MVYFWCNFGVLFTPWVQIMVCVVSYSYMTTPYTTLNIANFYV